MNSLKSLSVLLIVATLACIPWRAVQCSAGTLSEEIEDIEVFVRSVLAVAQPFGLGIAERLPVQTTVSPEAGHGQLATDLQRYLEGLLAVSSAVDRRTLVEMLLDDKLSVDEDLGPHRAFDRLYGGLKPET